MHIDFNFIIATFGAALVKVITSDNPSFKRSAMNVFVAVFSAYLFTEPVVHWLGLPTEIYTNPVAALLALTGDGLARWVIRIGSDPLKGYKSWKGADDDK